MPLLYTLVRTGQASRYIRKEKAEYLKVDLCLMGVISSSHRAKARIPTCTTTSRISPRSQPLSRARAHALVGTVGDLLG